MHAVTQVHRLSYMTGLRSFGTSQGFQYRAVCSVGHQIYFVQILVQTTKEYSFILMLFHRAPWNLLSIFIPTSQSQRQECLIIINPSFPNSFFSPCMAACRYLIMMSAVYCEHLLYVKLQSSVWASCSALLIFSICFSPCLLNSESCRKSLIYLKVCETTRLFAWQLIWVSKDLCRVRWCIHCRLKTHNTKTHGQMHPSRCY